ncbi:MAG TPA: DUF5694 domain-containing protein [Rhizomicrobium sp.]|nr:DUF5694 domain-containing protein [Rhizomicrobium sp.]
MKLAIMGLIGAVSWGASAVAWGASAVAADAPVQVMIVGGFHMSNPGRDMHNLKVDDVLAPRRQAEIAAVNEGLLRFHPTMVDVEWSDADAAPRYDSYVKGTLAPSRNEVVQLGFRLAKAAGLATVHGVDVEGDFPYDAVDAYAKAHGESALLDAQNAQVQAMVDRQGDILDKQGVAATLRFLNDPDRIRDDNAFYRTTLKIGGGADQPGAELLTAWYRRNFLICANIVQLAHPGDHVVVFYGSGHAFLLRQCIAETPGFELAEPNDYLPK